MESGAKTGRFVKGFVVGALVGAAIGLLVAPQPGKQTRNLIRRKTGGFVGSIRGRFGKGRPVDGTTNHTETHADVPS